MYNTSLQSLLLVLFAISLFCCNKPEIANIEGVYFGKVVGKYSPVHYSIGSMRLTMGKTEFLVDGNASEIPPNGSGSYEIIGDKILFIDSTLRALDSYSDFMLFGEYEFKFNGRKLKIWKEGDYEKYTYVLTKE